MTDYYNAINTLYTTPLPGNTENIAAEINKRQLLINFLGYSQTVTANNDILPVKYSPASYPNLVSSFPPKYPIRSTDISTPSLFNIYNTWNVSGNVDQFIQIFNQFTKTDLFTEANDVVEYFLSIFFQNKTYNIFTGIVLNNMPNLFPSSTSPNYTPLLKKIYMFYNYSNNPTSGVGRLGGSYINSICMNNFKLYLKGYNITTGSQVEIPKTFPEYENIDYSWVSYLQNTEANIAVTQYRNSVSTNDTLLDWCGCFTPPDQLLLVGMTGTNRSNDNVSDTTLCDPLCTNPNSIKRFSNFNRTGDFNLYLQCKANVCIIDNISITSIDSDIPATFTQVCPGCNVPGSTEACMCIIDTDTSSSTFGKIQNEGVTLKQQETFDQVCPNAQCYNVIDGKVIQIECNKQNTSLTSNIQNFRSSGMTEKKYYNVISKEFIVFTVLFFFVFFLIIVFSITDFFKVYSIS